MFDIKPQTVRENIYLRFHSIAYPEIMAFTIPSAPPKKVPFPKILCYQNSFMMKLPKKKNRTEAATGGVRWKKSCNFIKKETPTQLFSCKFCYILKNTFLTEYLRAHEQRALEELGRRYFGSTYKAR